MPQPIFPVTISEQEELDIVYEGLHNVYSNLLRSAEIYKRNLVTLEKDFADFLHSFQTDVNESILETEFDASEARRKEIARFKTEIKRKNMVKKEVEKKIATMHGIFKRMSDARPTEEQIEEWKERNKKASISQIMQNLEAQQVQAAASQEAK